MESPLRSVDEQLFKASPLSPSRALLNVTLLSAQLRQQLSAAKASASAANAAVGAYARQDALAAEEVRARRLPHAEFAL